MIKKNIIKVLVTVLIVITISIISFSIYIIMSCKNENKKLIDLKYQEDNIIQIKTSYDSLPIELIQSILTKEKDYNFLNNKTSIIKAIFIKDYSSITMRVLENQNRMIGESNFIKRIKLAYISKYYIEKKYSKKQIFEYYVNNAYLGGNGLEDAYGFASASQIYFEKPIKELTLSESATLASIIEFPNGYNPYIYEDRITLARNKLLDEMLENNFTVELQTNEAKNTSIKSLIKGNYTYNAKSVTSFIDYMNKLDEKIKNDYDTYNVKYNDLLFIAKADKNNNTTINYKTYKYEILYKDNIINNEELQNNESFSNTKFYVLNDNNKNNAYVLVSTISPAAVHQKYLITVFDESGNILLSKTIRTSKEIEVKSNIIYYSYETKLGEPITVENAIDESKNKEEFCKYLKENYTDDNYIISGYETFEYIDGKINQKEKEEKTVKYYKEKGDCK